MARTDEERERLKEWALNWRPQPTHDRLNRYARLKGRWSEYHKNRVVLRLTPAEREKAESIYHYLCVKHAWKVRSRPGYYRILWACSVSRCRKNKPHRYERLAFINKLTYWYALGRKEGHKEPQVEKRRSRRAVSLSQNMHQVGGLLTILEKTMP